MLNIVEVTVSTVLISIYLGFWRVILVHSLQATESMLLRHYLN
jgi:hypothetical protein